MAGAPRFRKTDDSVEAGFRRIAISEIDAAIAIIDAMDRTPEDKVHKLRRQMKSMRALLRLVGPAFDRYRRENRTFRDLARALSGSRDAKVMLDTFDSMTGGANAESGKGAPLPRAFLSVRERLCTAHEAHGDVHPLLVELRAALAKARGRAGGWSLGQTGWRAIAGGLSETYDHARKAMHAWRESGDAQAGHEWRKGVKYHGAHARLLRGMQRDKLRKREKAAARLADLLGTRHDIDMFLDAMAAAPARFGDIVTVTRLAALARRRIAGLDKKARRLGETLFSDKPDGLADQWGPWWRDWRED